MNKIKHILIATDGSEHASKAGAFGGDLARSCDARVSLVIVHDEQAVIPIAWKEVGLKFKDKSDEVTTENIRRRIEDNALANELAQSAAAVGDLGAAPELVNLWGQAADQICRYAASHDVDLIVIGSRGRSGIKQAILGSVSHAVANNAPCAVTIVR